MEDIYFYFFIIWRQHISMRHAIAAFTLSKLKLTLFWDCLLTLRENFSKNRLFYEPNTYLLHHVTPLLCPCACASIRRALGTCLFHFALFQWPPQSPRITKSCIVYLSSECNLRRMLTWTAIITIKWSVIPLCTLTIEGNNNWMFPRSGVMFSEFLLLVVWWNSRRGENRNVALSLKQTT